jgi:excisionase family DNA binding protein
MNKGIEQIIKEVELKVEKTKLEILALLHSIDPSPPNESVLVEAHTEALVPVPLVARHLGISEPQVRSLEKSGKLPSYRPGGRLLFKLSECEAAVRTERPVKQEV